MGRVCISAIALAYQSMIGSQSPPGSFRTFLRTLTVLGIHFPFLSTIESPVDTLPRSERCELRQSAPLKNAAILGFLRPTARLTDTVTLVLLLRR